MLDIDFCNGQNCPMKQVCQRYADYLYKLQIKQDVTYAKNGVNKDCPQFKPKAFTGD